MQLHLAVRQHDATSVKALIDEGADVLEEFEGTWQPVDFLWMQQGDGLVWLQQGEDDVDAAITCLKLLREAGATIGIRTLRQLTSEKAPLKIFRAVFEGANKTEYTDTLYGAILQKNDLEIVHFLLDRGADPNTTHRVNPNLPPPADMCIVPRQCLHVAIARDNTEVVRLLLDYGADPYVVCKKNGTTSFHWYATFGKKMRLIGDLWEAKKSFDAIKDRLHQELIEYVFHPARLKKIGYFRRDDLI